MTPREILRCQFDGEDGSFLTIARCELRWDWEAFWTMTSAMYAVAKSLKGSSSIDVWIANGFWFADTWIREWTSHPHFPRPEQDRFESALSLIHDLAYFLFFGQSPYEDDRLERMAQGHPLR